MTIRAKLWLLVSGLVAGSIGLAGAMHYAWERRARLAEAESAGEAAALRLSATAEEALRARDPEKLSAAFRSASESEPLLFAALVRADASAWWRQARDGYSEPVNEGGVRRAMAEGRLVRLRHDGAAPTLEFALPLKERAPVPTGATGTRLMGAVLRVGLDARELRAVADRAAWVDQRRLWWPAAASLLLGLLGAHWLSASFTRTIKKLMEGAQAMGAGHFSVRVRTRREDELRDLSDEFNDMGRRLAELERLKDSFLAKVTHDLRSPLGAIVSFAEVLQMGLQGPLSEAQKQSLDTISKSANDLAEMVNEILDLTELEAGRARFSPGPTELRPLAGDVVKLFKIKADEFGVGLDASEIPEGTMVWADRQALQRLLSNLVSNALKYTPKGGRVFVQWRRSAEGEDIVAVKDTGIGIPKDKLPFLFEKFFQVEETLHKVRHAKGTGLGLAICREIAEGHGGRIWVESEYQRGCTFFLALPHKEAAAVSGA